MPIPMPEQYEISPIKLWSPLQRQLAACGQSKGSPQQWIGTIRNLQNKGVSSVEIEWSGVMPMLGEDSEAGSVFEKLVVLAASLEEKPLHEPVKQPSSVVHVAELIAFLAVKPACELVLQRHITNEYVPQVRYEKLPRPAEIPPAVVQHGRREVRMLHYRDRTFGLCIWLHVEVDAGLFGRHRYWSLSVPHGRKKLAITPVGRRYTTGQEALAYGRALVGRMARRLSQEGFVGPTKGFNRFTRYSLPGGENYTEWLISAPNLSDRYWGEHFDLPNIVAHVRTTERASPQGARLLVMEEIQSDWNQALREAIRLRQCSHPTAGDGDNVVDWDDDVELPPDNPYLNHWLDAALRMMLLLAAQRGFSGISWLPGNLHAERFPWANAEGLATFYDRIVPTAMEKLAKSWSAHVGVAQFATLSRNYRVQKMAGKTNWRIINVTTGEAAGDEFTEHDKAELFRRSVEVFGTGGCWYFVPYKRNAGQYFAGIRIFRWTDGVNGLKLP
jgi:hypothetical protein